jgi:pilus assembly protein FimV
MTPAPPPPPKDDSVDVNDMLNAGKPEHEGLDPDSLDADFEQELEDLFSDDLEEERAAADEDGDEEPIVLDEYVTVENDGNVEVEEPGPENPEDPEDEDGDEPLLVLDDLAEDGDEPLLLDDVMEAEAGAADEDDEDVAALLDDIAEENAPEPEAAGDDEDIIELDDLLDEPTDEPMDELADLDDLLAEAGESGDDQAGDADEGPGPDMDMDLAGDEDGDEDELLLLDDVLPEEPRAESADEETDAAESPEISHEPESAADPLDAALADEADQADELPDIPVDQAVSEDALDLIMDEPAEESGTASDAAQEEGSPVIEGVDDSEISGLAGLDRLDDDMEDMDSLLDNVEVDVTDVVGGPDGDEEAGSDLADSDLDDMGLDDVDLPEMELPEVDLSAGMAAAAAMDMGDELAREAMPPDAGVDVSDEVDVDQLLADVRTETATVGVPELQAKVARLEARVAELEGRIREEIATLLPAEAARIIREEIVALASELDD